MYHGRWYTGFMIPTARMREIVATAQRCEPPAQIAITELIAEVHRLRADLATMETRALMAESGLGESAP